MINSRKQLLRSTDRSRQQQDQLHKNTVEFTPIGGISSVGVFNDSNLNGSPNIRRTTSQNRNSNNIIQVDSSFVEDSNFTGADIFEDDINLVNNNNNNDKHEYNNFVNENIDNIIPNSQDFNSLKTQNTNIQDLVKDNINLKIHLNSLKAQLDNVPRDKLELIALNSQLERDVGSLGKKVRALEANQISNEKLEEYEARIEDLQDENHIVVSDLKEVQNMLDTERQAKEALAKDLDRLENDHENQMSRLREDLAYLKEELQHKDERLNEMNDLNMNNDKLEELENENYGLRRELADLKDSTDKQLDELEGELHKVKNDETRLQAEVEKLSGLDKLNEDKIKSLEELNHELADYRKDAKLISEDKQVLSYQLKQLTSQNNTLSEEISQLKKSMKSNDSQLIRENERLKDELDSLTTDKEVLKERLESLQGEFNRVRNSIKLSDNQLVKELTADNEILSDKVKSLQYDNHHLQRSNKSTDSRLVSELTKDNQTLSDKIKSLQDEIYQLQRSTRSNDKSQLVRELNSDNEILTDALNDIKKQLHEKETEIQELQRDNRSTERINELREELVELKRSNQGLIEKLTDHKFENESLKQDKSKLLGEIEEVKDAFEVEWNKFNDFRDDYNFRLNLKDNEINELKLTINDLKSYTNNDASHTEIFKNFESVSKLFESKIDELKSKLQNSIPIAKYNDLRDALEETKKEINELKKSSLRESTKYTSTPTPSALDTSNDNKLNSKVDKLINEKFELMKSINSLQVTQDDLVKKNDKLSNQLSILRLQLDNNSDKKSTSDVSELNLEIQKLTLDLKSSDESYNELIMKYNSTKNQLITRLENERESNIAKGEENAKLIEEIELVNKEKSRILDESKGIKVSNSQLQESLKTKEVINETLVSVNNELQRKVQELSQRQQEQQQQQQHHQPMTPPSSIKRQAADSTNALVQRLHDLEKVNHINKEKLKLYSINKKEMVDKLDFLKSVNLYLSRQLNDNSPTEQVDKLNSLAVQDTTDLLGKAPVSPLSSSTSTTNTTGQITDIKQLLPFFVCFNTMVKMMAQNKAKRELKNEIKSNILK